ncbi:putative membrane protein [Ogataea parapolymorpha DL-1]|uniref:Membrane protein n=1 Tax=Ogataea parapolymorpha (strain ATCC 26012 / BCRC 20466 / JCM 22074 / NRRL Y-7560 / DL-1) TaxID=871575 RepID=W1QJ40_OGAPD|nr:putative membrane protein [Ogataea parapolymorpha DL-1]ESX00984.1 putative membrane protein [Ogataea parapolymorpha DL-1]
MEHPSFTLGGLCLIGGAMGFARKRSMPSLIAGVSMSALYFTAGYLLKNNMEWGIHTALATSAVLCGAGISRSLKVGFKPVPASLTVLGAASSAYYAYKYTQFYM